jgi:hypothetical protein
MKIQMPEVLTLSSAILLVGGQIIPGWVFFSLGILGAIMRLGLEQQAKQEQAKTIEGTAQSITDAGEAIGKFLNALGSSGRNSNTDLN